MLSRKLQAEVVKIVHKRWQIPITDVEVTPPKDLWQGDFSTNVALKVAARWGVPTAQVVDTLIADLVQRPFIKRNCLRVQAAGPGFVNFFLSPTILYREVERAAAVSSHSPWRGKRVVVEYSSPNIAKPMHVGHLRSTIIGQALANLYRALGARVISLNYLGDWGTQFGKLLIAYQHWGSREKLKHAPIDEMLRLYVKFHKQAKTKLELEAEAQAAFRQLEGGDRKLTALWRMFRRYSLVEFNRLYRRLQVRFSRLEGESLYQTALPRVVLDLVKKRIATRNTDGSIVVLFNGEKIPPLLVQKSDGASLYATRDLVALKSRVSRYHPAVMLYVVANQQALYFEQLLAVARAAGYAGRVRLHHVKFGLVLAETGKKMATREGQIIKLEELLNKAVDLAWRVVEKKNSTLSAKERVQVAEVVGVGAIKYNDLSQNRHTDITFNWDKMLSLEGNSGPYLQYTYVRLRSILRNAARLKLAKFSPQSLTDRDLELLRKLAQYPEALVRAARENGPHLVALYLYELANSVNSYYHESPVLRAAEPMRSTRLALVQVAARILKHGLGILGIQTVERM